MASSDPSRTTSQSTAHGPVEPTLLNGLEWRSIGPYRGGRVVAVSGDPVHAQTFYFGSTGGGVWKTTDGGLYWQNVSDGYFKRASVGSIAVAPSDPNVIYVGMGEATIRGNVSHGDGVYRSTDGGATWRHLGLAETRNIGKVRVHPENPDIAYVAAFGHAHGPNRERGVYRTRDGGATWEQVLFRSERAGAIDLAIDPNNPRTLFATFWEAVRTPSTLISGGEGCGIFKSTDGGDTWVEITRNPGLPKGLLGKIGVAISPARPDRIWAIVEAEDGAVFRSDNGGQTWERLSEERDLRERAWYYMHIIADPQDAETLWVLNVRAWRSIDGGKTFTQFGIPHGDNHDLWIDPRNPQRLIQGNDGGAAVSFNGGASFSSLYNQPTSEFYHVTTDTQTPYRVYGSQQDNSSMSVPSRSLLDAITLQDYEEVGGGESGYIAVRPDDPNVIFAGNYQGYITRYDRRTGQARDITAWPEGASGWGAKDLKYRFQWTYPIVLSPHDPNVLYITGNHVFRSTNEGSSWEQISPDLTRNDPTTMEPSGGPITKDNTGAEYYGTIFAFAESPLTKGVFWAGSDDGLVHISRDGGASWQNVTPADLPEWSLISLIEASPHDPACAYLAANRYKHDDFRPFLYKTSDYGATWTPITTGIADDDFTRAIREDPERRGLLYAGTETGVFVSFDDGAHWQSLRRNLPVVPIHDLVVKGSDLVVATHGRSFWILDDLTPLRRLDDTARTASAQLYPPRPTTRFLPAGGYGGPATVGKSYRSSGSLILAYRQVEQPTGEQKNVYLDAGQNPPDGVIVYYSLGQQVEGDVQLTFLDAEGHEIKSFSSEAPAEAQGSRPSAAETGKKEPRLPKQPGTNRFVWNMRAADPTRVQGYMASEDALVGPMIAPGQYSVRLTVGEQTLTQPFVVEKDPRVSATQPDLDAQYALLLRIRDKLSQTHDAINRIRSIKQQAEEWQRRTGEHEHGAKIAEAGKALAEKLSAIEEELTQVKAKNRQDTLDFPIQLNTKLAMLSGTVASADAAPTSQSVAVFDDLAGRIDAQIARLQSTIETDVAAYNTLLRESGTPAIIPSAAVAKHDPAKAAARRQR